jgi:PAS domain S-box-containing protein
MLMAKTSDAEIVSFVIQATNDGIWDWDLISNYIYFAPRYKAMLGYADNEFANSMAEKLGKIHPEDKERERDITRKYLAHEIPEYKDTYRMRHKDGSWRWIMSRAIALWDADGRPYRMIGSNTDITEQKTLEKALMAARDKAESANQAKLEFLANISHELRTPMNAVVGLANILMLNGSTPAKQRECITTLQLSAQSLMSLINDLLDIAKFEGSDVKLEHIPFNLAEMIEEIVTIMSVKAEEKNIELLINYSPMLNTEFIGDPLRLRQILMNLTGNAVKFTAKGSVTVHVESKRREKSNNIDLTVNVIDTGIGIKSDKLDTVFNKFSQADTSITRKYGGTGLGLSICKTLVTLMNGTISVKSTPRKGSRFIVTIPLQLGPKGIVAWKGGPRGAGHDAAGSSGPAGDPDKPLVLLVEDYKPNVLVAGMLLENLGYRYEVASNGKKALRKLEHRHFDMILMDVQMQEMDGLETTRHIRKLEKKKHLPRMPIIAMTAHALADDRERCLKAGMDDYISKPFNPKELQEKLEHFTKR